MRFREHFVLPKNGGEGMMPGKIREERKIESGSWCVIKIFADSSAGLQLCRRRYTGMHKRHSQIFYKVA